MSTNVDVTLIRLLASVEDLAEAIDSAKLLRELNDQLESLISRHESEAHPADEASPW